MRASLLAPEEPIPALAMRASSAPSSVRAIELDDMLLNRPRGRLAADPSVPPGFAGPLLGPATTETPAPVASVSASASRSVLPLATGRVRRTEGPVTRYVPLRSRRDYCSRSSSIAVHAPGSGLGSLILRTAGCPSQSVTSQLTDRVALRPAPTTERTASPFTKSSTRQPAA